MSKSGYQAYSSAFEIQNNPPPWRFMRNTLNQNVRDVFLWLKCTPAFHAPLQFFPVNVKPVINHG